MFTLLCSHALKHIVTIFTLICRNNDYTEFNTYYPKPVVTDQYDILNTTNMGKYVCIIIHVWTLIWWKYRFIDRFIFLTGLFPIFNKFMLVYKYHIMKIKLEQMSTGVVDKDQCSFAWTSIFFSFYLELWENKFKNLIRTDKFSFSFRGVLNNDLPHLTSNHGTQQDMTLKIQVLAKKSLKISKG